MNKQNLIAFFSQQARAQASLTDLRSTHKIPVDVLSHPAIIQFQDISKQQAALVQRVLFALEHSANEASINTLIITYQENYNDQRARLDRIINGFGLPDMRQSIYLGFLPENLHLDITPAASFGIPRQTSFDEIVSALKMPVYSEHAHPASHASSERAASPAETDASLITNRPESLGAEEPRKIQKVYIKNEDKAARRTRMNKESAQRSRSKHKHDVEALIQERDELRIEVTDLKRENAALKQQMLLVRNDGLPPSRQGNSFFG